MCSRTLICTLFVDSLKGGAAGVRPTEGFSVVDSENFV